MNKNQFATVPPMGWNSYDYYDTTVTEDAIKKNAEYMAKNLKEYGWEYIVVDIEWYAYGAGTQRRKFQYIPFSKLEMDEYSRLLPCVDRFPSSAGGKGFKPLADYIHSLGLKFGIHIMRGIPRTAAHEHMKMKGTTVTANEIAEANNICWWNPDMYGVDTHMPESQLYYDSIFELYADWGVDFVKCDDICRMDAPTAKKEIEMLHNAIMKSGRNIVLSLSPGPAKVTEAWHYEQYSNMWRITDDFWDKWELLYNMFERCEHWQEHVSEGCYPDCDMIPIGQLGKGFGHERTSNFTHQEIITMMSLWSIFRSPMMLGCELPLLNEKTSSYITNKDVLHLLSLKNQAKQVKREKDNAIWMNTDDNSGAVYLAVFNLGEGVKDFSINLKDLGICKDSAKELWTKENIKCSDGYLKVSIEEHGAGIYRFL